MGDILELKNCSRTLWLLSVAYKSRKRPVILYCEWQGAFG